MLAELWKKRELEFMMHSKFWRMGRGPQENIEMILICWLQKRNDENDVKRVKSEDVARAFTYTSMPPVWPTKVKVPSSPLKYTEGCQ